MAEIRVPTLGESVTEATVATWFKKVGDAVAQDEMLCELETDKVTVEVPATSAGTLSEIVAKEGETVGVDALLANIDEKADAKPAAKAASGSAPKKAAAAESKSEAPAKAASERTNPPRERTRRRDGPRPGRKRHRGDRRHLVQKGRRRRRPGRDALRTGDRQGLRRGPLPGRRHAVGDPRRGRRGRRGRRQTRRNRRRRLGRRSDAKPQAAEPRKPPRRRNPATSRTPPPPTR